MSGDLDSRWVVVKEGYSPNRIYPETIDDERIAWGKGMVAFFERSGQNLSLLEAGEMLTELLHLKKLCEHRGLRMQRILADLSMIHMMSGVDA